MSSFFGFKITVLSVQASLVLKELKAFLRKLLAVFTGREARDRQSHSRQTVTKYLNLPPNSLEPPEKAKTFSVKKASQSIEEKDKVILEKRLVQRSLEKDKVILGRP